MFKQLKCCIIGIDQKALSDLISQFSELILINCNFDVADFLAFKVSSQVTQDITFVDMDVFETLGKPSFQNLDFFYRVVYYGSNKNLAADAFDLGGLDYLLKPISEDRFDQCIKKIKNKLDATEMLSSRAELPYFFIQTEVKGKFMRIMKEEIVYVESALNYLHIHLDGKVCSTYLTIRELEGTLHFPQFVRVHKSFIVNMDRVIGVEGNMISLDTKGSSNKDFKIPLGPNYREAFFERINSVLVKSKRLVV